MIRRSAVAAGACVLLHVSAACADDPPLTTVTFQPLSLITGYIDLEVERAFGRHVSLYLAPGGNFSTGRRLDGSTTGGLFAWSIDVGARWFPMRRAPSGLFVDLSGGYFTSWFDLAIRYRGDGARGMLLVGYTLVLWRHLTLSAGLGAQYRVVRSENSDASEDRWAPAVRLAIGAAF